MNNLLKMIVIRFAVALAVAAMLAVSTVSTHAQSASATISDVPAGGNFDYTITMKNTGTLSLNSFWYAPDSAMEPLGMPLRRRYLRPAMNRLPWFRLPAKQKPWGPARER